MITFFFILASPTPVSERCPICQVMFPLDFIEIHASACGERLVHVN